MRDEIIPDEEIEEEINKWKEFLILIDKAVDAAHEYLCKCEGHRVKFSCSKRMKTMTVVNLELPSIELPKFGVKVQY